MTPRCWVKSLGSFAPYSPFISLALEKFLWISRRVLLNGVAYRIDFEHWIPFPLEQVFVFFANPQNLARIMPPKSDTRIEKLQLVPPTWLPPGRFDPGQVLAGVGSEIITSFRTAPPLPFRGTWIARITEFEWNHHFCDVQVKGPFARWRHRHGLTAEERNGVIGTRVRDEVEYEIGYGLLGGAAQKLFVGPQMKSTFEHRQRVLENLLRESLSQPEDA